MKILNTLSLLLITVKEILPTNTERSKFTL